MSDKNNNKEVLVEIQDLLNPIELEWIRKTPKNSIPTVSGGGVMVDDYSEPKNATSKPTPQSKQPIPVKKEPTAIDSTPPVKEIKAPEIYNGNEIIEPLPENLDDEMITDFNGEIKDKLSIENSPDNDAIDVEVQRNRNELAGKWFSKFYNYGQGAGALYFYDFLNKPNREIQLRQELTAKKFAGTINEEEEKYLMYTNEVYDNFLQRKMKFQEGTLLDKKMVRDMQDCTTDCLNDMGIIISSKTILIIVVIAPIFWNMLRAFWDWVSSRK